MTRNASRNQMRQTAFIGTLDSDANHHACHRTAQCSIVVRPKTCEAVSIWQVWFGAKRSELSVCLSVSVAVSVCLCPSVCLSLSLSVCLSLSLAVSVCLSLSLCLSLCVSLCLSVSVSVSLSLSLSLVEMLEL